MRLIGDEILSEFARENPKAAKSAQAWKRCMEAGSFRHFADLKKAISSADYVKPYTVFNISKNKYRLIAQVAYLAQKVRVVAVLTHAEYDKAKWKEAS